MKIRLILVLLVITSFLSGEVLFYDNFEREDGEVGNGWTKVDPSVNSSIEAGVMRIDASSNYGVKRTFEELNSGIYYVQYDWEFLESNWFVSSFPTDVPVYLLWENTGSIYSSANGFLGNQTLLGHFPPNAWISLKWEVNIDNNQYSLWINDDLILDNQVNNSISSFSEFNFLTLTASSQRVDNFLVYNDALPPAPTGLSTTASVNNITLDWDQAENNDFLSYKIYRSTSSTATDLIAEINGDQNQYTDNSVQANTDYFYRIKAVALDTLESSFSQEVTAHLLPQPQLHLESNEINIRVDNPIQDITINLENSGAYQLSYNLSGTDDLMPDNQLREIEGFSPMDTYEGHTYYVSNNRMSWYNAKLLCEEKGGHLVTISDLAENTFVYENTTDKSWLGLTDEAQEGVWEWVTGEEVNFTHWLPGEPNNSSNDEHYAHLRHTVPLDKWNDQYNDSTLNPYAVLEFDFLFSPSILLFNNDIGTIETGESQDFNINIDASNLDDGVYETSIKLIVAGISEPFYYPITLNVDFNPPLSVEGVMVDDNTTNADQIGVTWTSNPAPEQVETYRIFRKGRDELDWSLMGQVAASQNSFIDNNFTPLDTTYVYYSLQAEDWVGNLSLMSEPIIASLERYLAPENLQITNLDDRDIKLTWSPVTQTISGVPGTPNCYLIYKSQNPTPLSDFDFLAVSFTPEYNHDWALYFQPADRLYYIVTAYGGDLNRLNRVLSQKKEWTKRELEESLR